MAFLDEARGHISAYHQNRCSVHAWLETQDDLNDTILLAAIEATSRAAVVKAMQGRGFPYKRTSVERHFRGECSCPTS